MKLGTRRGRRRRHPVAPDRRDESGFTLVEVLVAASVFAMFAAVAATGIEGSLTATATNRSRVVAAGLVSQTLDQVQATPFGGIPALNSTTTTQTVGSTTYTVAIRTAVVSPPGGTPTGSCAFNAAGTDGENVVVDVSVTWPAMQATPVTGQVELSPPAKTIAAGAANLTVQVVGAGGTPRVGAALVLTPGPVSATTDSNGCASWTGLAPGQAYTVAATAAAGLIDQSQSDQGVSVGQPTTATWTSPTLMSASYNFQQLTWDHPAVLSFSDNPPSGYTAPNTNLCYNGNFSGSCQPWANGLGPDLQASTAVGGAPNDTLYNVGTVSWRSVFPFSDWRVWTGDCANADPGVGGSLIAVTGPGSQVAVNAPLVPVAVVSHTTSSIPAYNGATYAYLYAYFSGSGDTRCPGGQNLGFYIPANSKGPYSVALPAGSWKFYYWNPSAPSTVQAGSPQTTVTPGATPAVTVNLP